MLIILIFPILACYLLGSIPFGYVLTKIITKQDIRETGSGNIGATNVLRTGNKKLALATLLLDVAKCFPAIFIADMVYAWFYRYDTRVHFDGAYESFLVIGGFLAILGHCHPIWLKFKGGKGVATALGALLAAVPYAGLAACATWLITAKITKISSLSALIAVLIAPIVTFFVYGASPAGICAMITLLVWIRHKDNIKRLLKGEEPKIGSKKKKEEPVESVSND